MSPDLIEPTESKELNGGQQRTYRFDNGYGASVICNQYSYGHEAGLFELGVLKYDDKGGSELNYDTPITDDVIGWLDEDAVQRHLQLIQALPAATA